MTFRNPEQYPPRYRRQSGVTLVEVITVVVVIGILAAITIPQFADLHDYAEDRTAKHHLARLNKAVLSHSQSISELTIAAADGSSDDEIAVAAALQTRDDSVPGTPFLEPEWTAIPTSDTDQFRAVWNGRMFELVGLGEGGAGLLLDVDR